MGAAKGWRAFGEKREYSIGAALLSLYGLALFLSDPEWAMWAGAMSVGAIPIGDVPPALPILPVDLFAGSTILAVLGLCAFGALMRACETFHGMRFRDAVTWCQKGRR